MSVLQAYQAELLRDLDQGQGLSPEAVADLTLRATKQTAAEIGSSIVAMVATERHLWVNLADIGEKEKRFFLDTPVSPSELFGTSVEMVIHKFGEARARSAAYESFIPCRFMSALKHRGGPGQVVSVATCGPPRTRSQRRRSRDLG